MQIPIPILSKIAYAVFMASRKLRHYFQECSITVASEVPLNDIINNCDATGRIAKWTIEPLPFDITYKPLLEIVAEIKIFYASPSWNMCRTL